MRAGVALNPATPVAVLEDVLPDLDFVLVMSVDPGWSGQPFIPAALGKATKLRDTIARRGLATEIEMDGGIGPANIATVAQSGVTIAVAGSRSIASRIRRRRSARCARASTRRQLHASTAHGPGMRLDRRCCRALLGGALLLGACGGGGREDPILQLSSEEALEEGRKLMAEGKLAPARKYFIHAFEVEPNSASGREGLLLAADAYFMAGGQDNLIKAEARYRDFVNRFPTSEHAAYAQFQIGLTLSRRIAKPDRDQSISKQALESLEDVERFYPTSEFAAQATEEAEQVRAHLAEHDYMVGRFYERFGLPNSAIDRYEYLLENYADYAEKDKVLYHLCTAYLARKGQGDRDLARETCQRLESEYPESKYVEKIPKRWPEEPEPATVKQPAETTAGADPAPDPGPPASDDGL